VEALLPRITAIVDALLAEVDGGEWDLIEGLAYPLPVMPIAGGKWPPSANDRSSSQFVGHWVRDEVAVRAFWLADVEALEASAAQQTRPPSGAPGEKVGDDRRRRSCDCPDLQAGPSRC